MSPPKAMWGRPWGRCPPPYKGTHGWGGGLQSSSAAMAPNVHPWVALGVLVVLLGGGRARQITVDNGGLWGEWGEVEFCPKGSFVTGFQLKVGEGGGRGGTFGGGGSMG